MPGTPTAARICSTRASKPSGGSARAAPARHQAAAASTATAAAAGDTLFNDGSRFGERTLRPPEPRPPGQPDRPGPGQAQAERAIGKGAGRADARDAEIVRQVLSVELDGPPAVVDAGTEIQRHVAVRPANAAVGRPVVELDGSVARVPQAGAYVG